MKKWTKKGVVYNVVLFAAAALLVVVGVPTPIRLGIVGFGTLIVWGLMYRDWRAERAAKPGGGE